MPLFRANRTVWPSHAVFGRRADVSRVKFFPGPIATAGQLPRSRYLTVGRSGLDRS